MRRHPVAHLVQLAADAVAHAPTDSVDVDDWQDAALCRDLPADLFFPDSAGPVQNAAISVCAACHVRESCLEHALDHGIDQGVWGGASERARRRMQRRRQQWTA